MTRRPRASADPPQGPVARPEPDPATLPATDPGAEHDKLWQAVASLDQPAASEAVPQSAAGAGEAAADADPPTPAKGRKAR